MSERVPNSAGDWSSDTNQISIPLILLFRPTVASLGISPRYATIRSGILLNNSSVYRSNIQPEPLVRRSTSRRNENSCRTRHRYLLVSSLLFNRLQVLSLSASIGYPYLQTPSLLALMLVFFNFGASPSYLKISRVYGPTPLIRCSC